MMIRPSALSGILAASLLASFMCIFRTQYTNDFAYGYMIINIILAWIPFLISLVLAGIIRHKEKATAWAFLIVWILFLPNTFYLLTDFIHLKSRPPIPVIFDAAMLTLFAIAGLALGFGSLLLVAQAVKKYISEQTFIVGAILVASYGVYIGRFLRWNSWDIFLRPIAVLKDSAKFIVSPHAVAFTGAFSLVLILVYMGMRPHLKKFLQ